MIYRNERCVIVLDKGKTKGFKWAIVSFGTHPVAYVGIPKEHPYYRGNYDDMDINCHGGFDKDLARVKKIYDEITKKDYGTPLTYKDINENIVVDKL